MTFCEISNFLTLNTIYQVYILWPLGKIFPLLRISLILPWFEDFFLAVIRAYIKQGNKKRGISLYYSVFFSSSSFFPLFVFIFVFFFSPFLFLSCYSLKIFPWGSPPTSLSMARIYIYNLYAIHFVPISSFYLFIYFILLIWSY